MSKIKAYPNGTGDPPKQVPTTNTRPGPSGTGRKWRWCHPWCSLICSKTPGATSYPTSAIAGGARSLLKSAHGREHGPSGVSRTDGGELSLESGSVWKHKGISHLDCISRTSSAPSSVPHRCPLLCKENHILVLRGLRCYASSLLHAPRPPDVRKSVSGAACQVFVSPWLAISDLNVRPLKADLWASALWWPVQGDPKQAYKHLAFPLPSYKHHLRSL